MLKPSCKCHTYKEGKGLKCCPDLSEYLSGDYRTNEHDKRIPGYLKSDHGIVMVQGNIGTVIGNTIWSFKENVRGSGF
jgi:hypothetical protein